MVTTKPRLPYAGVFLCCRPMLGQLPKSYWPDSEIALTGFGLRDRLAW